MELYNPTVDYKTMHLEWIKNNRGFRPKGGVMPIYNNYFDQMVEMYNQTLKQNTTAYIYLRDDYAFSKRSKTINEEVAIMFGDKVENTNPKFFVTFNWTDHNFCRNKILTGVERLFSKTWVDDAKGVFEYNTEKGTHPHFHCVIQVNKFKTIGKFRDKIFESSLASTLEKNFIDVKVAIPYHDDYIDGDKKDSKKEYLEKDKLWRIENNLGEIYKK